MDPAVTCGKYVLIVEDNPLNMKLFSAMVGAEGYGVLQAVDGPAGVDMAHREAPDLIVMDVNLPGLSGLEATRMLKDDPDTADIPIIITTAFGMHENDPEIVESGCDAFLAKPIVLADFAEAVDRLIQRNPGEPRFVRRMIAASGGDPTAA